MSASSFVSEALSVQRAISKQLSDSLPMEDKLHNILKAFSDSDLAQMAVLYATVDDNYLECVSAYKADSYKTTIRYEEGIIGKSAATKCSLLETDEQNHIFAASVPILRMHSVIGVIFLTKQNEAFTDAQTEIIETLALSLTDVMSSRQFADYRNQLVKEKGIEVKETLRGVSLNKGYAVGRAVVHNRHRELVNIFAENIELEQSKLQQARDKMLEYIDNKISQAGQYIGNTTAIIEAYKMFAQDKGWYNKISASIAKGYTAEAAVEYVYEDMWNKLSATNDAYIKEKLYDLRDVSDRLRAFIVGDNEVNNVAQDEDIIVFAQNMGPADLMDYNSEHIKGLVIEDGTSTMHAVIVAKAMNIPVLSKISGITKQIKIGEIVALSGDSGTLYTNPTEEQISEYQKKSVGLKKIFAELSELGKKPTATADGIKVNLAMNYGLDLDFEYLKPTNCDGIGLYRTEMMFMSVDKMPSVEQQSEQYKKLFDALGNKKIIFRSLDVGSDKFLPYWGDIKEENPAIGWRSIRITLDRRSILRQQIRALLRASVGKELNIMFPMIATLQEFREAKETLMLEYEKEKQKNNAVAKKINVGIMIEVPSVILQLDEILQEADFVSVGTNDLYQFTFACDRGNPRLSNRYDVLSAPFLRMMKIIVEKANQYKVYCSVCGEMASNPLEAMVLIGLGYRNLSVSGAAYGNVKKMILSMNNIDVTDYVKSIIKLPKNSLRPQLMAYAYDHGIEIN